MTEETEEITTEETTGVIMTGEIAEMTEEVVAAVETEAVAEEGVVAEETAVAEQEDSCGCWLLVVSLTRARIQNK